MDPVLQLFVVLLVAAGGAFFGSYLRERGRNWATHEDLKKLTAQVRATTEAAEQIKRTIAREDWKEREWETLRRVKLEELLTLAQRCLDWSEQMQRHICFEGPPPVEATDPLAHASSISALYFPELRAIFNQFERASHESRMRCAEARSALVGFLIPSEERLVALKGCVPPIFEAFREATYARTVLVAAAAVMVHQHVAAGRFGPVIPIPPRAA